MKLRIIDFESTGLPTEEEEHSICEASYVDIDPDSQKVIGIYDTLVTPTTEMSVEALSVHHITDLTGAVSWEEAQDRLKKCDLQYSDCDLIYVAHNAKFEKQFFNPEGSKWIDTYKCAIRLYPDAPRHTNQILKYYLEIPDEEKHHPPHRALPDCYVTAEILVRMLQHEKQITIEDMIRVSDEPPYLTKIGFGKHFGTKFKDLPRSYLEWLSKQTEMDDGVAEAVERAMK